MIFLALMSSFHTCMKVAVSGSFHNTHNDPSIQRLKYQKMTKWSMVSVLVLFCEDNLINLPYIQENINLYFPSLPCLNFSYKRVRPFLKKSQNPFWYFLLRLFILPFIWLVIWSFCLEWSIENELIFIWIYNTCTFLYESGLLCIMPKSF